MGFRRLFDTLAQLDLVDNILVLFSSDNGAQHEAHNQPFRSRKQQVLEGGMRVPLIAHWPNIIPADSHCDRLLSLMDVLPTVARLAGAELPQDRGIGLNLQ